MNFCGNQQVAYACDNHYPIARSAGNGGTDIGPGESLDRGVIGDCT